MAIETVHLKNFSLFSDFKLKAVPGVNVIIGENGTGKTHILKAIYAVCNVSQNTEMNLFEKHFALKPKYELSKTRGTPATIEIQGTDLSDYKTTDFGNNRQVLYKLSYPSEAIEAVYIPVKDMLTHSKGLLEMAEKYKGFPFDKTLLDIVRIAKRLPLKQPPELACAILPKLEKMIGGTVDYDDEEFSIRKQDGHRVNFSIQEEGFKKIGLLWQLLMNESITPGSVLLWDEPDANLNPKFLPTLVDCLLELSRHGVQIFLGTHSYLFAKYFDVKRQNDDVLKFHSLYQKKNDIACETGDTFVDLKHNAIMEAFDALVGEVYGIKMD